MPSAVTLQPVFQNETSLQPLDDQRLSFKFMVIGSEVPKSEKGWTAKIMNSSIPFVEVTELKVKKLNEKSMIFSGFVDESATEGSELSMSLTGPDNWQLSVPIFRR